MSTQGLIEKVIFVQEGKGGGVVIQKREFKFSFNKDSPMTNFSIYFTLTYHNTVWFIRAHDCMIKIGTRPH